MLYFLRHGKTNLPYRSHDEMPFETLADLASGKMEPPLDQEVTRELVLQTFDSLEQLNVEEVCSSPSQRSRDTAPIVQGYLERRFGNRVQISVMPSLREISFDLRQIYPVPPDRIDMADVNRKVLQAMAKERRRFRRWTSERKTSSG